MLEFIVLGQIPGTSLVVTFSWVLVATLLITFSLPFVFIQRHRLRKLIRQIRHINDVAI